jgi:hypothetical protein
MHFQILICEGWVDATLQHFLKVHSYIYFSTCSNVILQSVIPVCFSSKCCNMNQISYTSENPGHSSTITFGTQKWTLFTLNNIKLAVQKTYLMLTLSTVPNSHLTSVYTFTM